MAHPYHNLKYKHHCNQCGFDWLGYRERPKFCPSCNRTGWDDVAAPRSVYDINLAEYRRMIHQLKRGESIKLPWLSRDWPDSRMLKMVLNKNARKLFTVKSPREYLEVTRRLVDDVNDLDHYESVKVR